MESLSLITFSSVHGAVGFLTALVSWVGMTASSFVLQNYSCAACCVLKMTRIVYSSLSWL